MPDIVSFLSFLVSTIEAIAKEKKESNPYRVRVTGRCGMILPLSRLNAYIG